MKIGMLIINYNDYETTEKLLNNIKEYSIIDKIVVVDNHSSDDSLNKLQKFNNKKIDIISTPENKGYGYGINYGSKYLEQILKECYIIVSNPDVVIYNEEDIKKLINTFDDTTGIVAPVILEHDGYNRGWKIPTPFQDSLLNIPYIHRYLRPKMLFYKESELKDIKEVEAVSGCFFLINSKFLKEVNYFDESIFLYYEENVISKKLQKINKKVLLNTNVEVFHNHSVTIDKNITSIKKYKELKKSQYYFHKYYNNANIIERLLLIITNKITLCLLYIANFIKK
jgi:hypothetical protein